MADNRAADVIREGNWRSLLAAAFLLTLAVCAVSRTLSFVSTIMNSDVEYMYSPAMTVLDYLRRVVTASVYGVVRAVAAAAAIYLPVKKRVSAGLLCAAAVAVNLAAAFVIDSVRGAISGRAVVAALNLTLALAGDIIIFTFIFIVASVVAARSFRGGDAEPQSGSLRNAAGKALLYTAILTTGFELVRLTADVVFFLVDISFQPYPQELAGIAGDFIALLLIDGVISYFISAAIYPALRKAAERSPRIKKTA